MRSHASLAVTLCLLLGLAACSTTARSQPPASSAPSASAAAQTPGSTTAGTATPGGTPDRIAGWQSDLALLLPGMERLHPDLYHGVSNETLADAITAISASVPTATDDELLDGVLRAVGLVSAGGCDAHTGAYIWGSGRYPLDSLPLRLWLFGEDLVVVDALPPYEQLVGARIVSIESRATADVLAAIDPLVPRDNEQTVRLLTPRFVLIPQVLRGLGIADAGPIALVVEQGDGRATNVEIAPIPMADYNAWAGPYGLHLPADPDVLYLSRMDEALSWNVLPDLSSLYVQYNRVDRLDSKLVADLGSALRDPAYDRIVLDLRHNFGGELHALDPIVALFQDASFDEPHRLFVITGRNTFSAASLLVARLQRDTAAEVLGEPMGGCPTFWSDPAPLTLPWSGIEVGVADDVAVGVDPNDTRHGILPDATIELTLDEWLGGDDPVLGSLIATGP